MWSGGATMHNPKVAVVCYVLAVGFIFAVAFHFPSKIADHG
jgi:hypothetical protein